MLSFFPRDVLDEIWDLIGSVSEGFPTYFFIYLLLIMFGWKSCDFLKYILWPNMIGSGWLYIIIFAICKNLFCCKVKTYIDIAST